MVATLTRIFGLEHLTLAEDVVQEALARALQTWPFYGVPKNPGVDHARFPEPRAGRGPARKGVSQQRSGNCPLDRGTKSGARCDRFRRPGNHGRPSAPDVRVLPSGDSRRGASRAGLEDTLRIQRGGDQQGVSDDGSRHRQAIDTSKTKDSRGSNPFRDSRWRGTREEVGRRPAIALPAL